MLETLEQEQEIEVKKNNESKLSKGLIISYGVILFSLPTIINLYFPNTFTFWQNNIPAVVQSLMVILSCCLLIWKTSDGFEEASDFLADKLGMDGGVKGATINAIGSSLPELFTTFFFLVVLRNAEGFAGGIGTTAGSAVFNAMIIPAAVILSVFFSMGKTVIVDKRVILRDGLFLIFAELVLVVLLNDDAMGWKHGVLLMGVYVIYLAILRYWKIETEEDNDIEEDLSEEEDERVDSSFSGKLKSFFKMDLESLIIGNHDMTSAKAWQLLLASVVLMGLACHLLTETCTMLGEALNIHSFVVAIIFAAAATSVPDTFISIKDAKKGNYNDAVANALGSNIFDICFALGLPLTIYCLFNGEISMGGGESITNSFIGQFRVLLLFATIIAFAIYYFGKGMGKSKAFLLLGVYACFIIYTILFAYSPEHIQGIQNVLINISTALSKLNFL